ncbi:AraC family transcriptional regulator [Paenibacillus sp. 32O-W]|uniref:helix-turn-helix domain-containing protein n=1 Tax=Paenibacillus sp. 32O-W TaxID=1695218 RepID=UPI0007223289|nr:helix-turn-helix domain-containing protein [Paenibacillus sp. 32O-W]ALS26504.1 AraC family transcriptional regulator [Paenibacillus sp. 32O-W]
MIKSQRFYNYLFSYILLTIILLLIMSVVVYNNFLDTLRDEVERATIASLDQFRETLDQRILEMDQMALQISRNAQLTPYMATANGYGPYKAIEELKQYLSTNMFIHDIVIRFHARTPEQLYATSGTYGIDLFFEDIFRFESWSKDDFIRLSASLTAPVMRPVETVRYNRVVDERYAVYLSPLPSGSDSPYGVAMFLIDESAFRSLAANVLGEYNGMLYLLNGDNEVLYEYAKGDAGVGSDSVPEQLRAMDGDWSIANVSLDGRKYTAIRHISAKYGYSYVALMPTDQIMRKVDESRLLFNFTFSVVFVLGVILAVAFSIRNYKPLQKLAGIVSSQHQADGLPDARGTDELDYISTAVVQMAKEKEGLIHRLHSQANALREQVLLSLIKGKFKTREEWEDMLHFSNLRLDRPYFAVLLFLIDDYDKFRQDNSDSMQNLLKYSLVKVLEELSVEAGHGFGVELVDGRSIVFLINLNEGFDDEEVLRELAMEAKQIFHQYFRFTVTTGIGSICSDFTAVSRSFIEASHAARYRLVKGGNQVIFFRDIEQANRKDRWYPVETVERLVRAIRQGDGQAVEETVRQAFGHIPENNMPIGAAEYICFDIVNNIAKTLIELDIELDEAMSEALERLFVPHFETIEELERLVTDICRNVCRFIAGQKESKNIELLNRMKAYIDDHYTDHSITLESIAEQFGISPSYATRFFKDQTGESLMRYIDGLRMRQAKRLLKTTDLKLKDIMLEVGYVDSTNFIRKFKKNEGVTPIQYRNITNSGT